MLLESAGFVPADFFAGAIVMATILHGGKLALSSLLLICATTEIAKADFVPFSGLAPNMGMVALNNSVLENNQRNSERPRPAAPSARLPLQKYQQNADLRQLVYVVSLDRRRINLTNFAKTLDKFDDSRSGTMGKFFRSRDVVAMMETPLRNLGLRVDNVADAYAVWWVAAWKVANGRDDMLTRAQAQAVRAQAAQSIASNRQFQLATDAQKQEVAEALIVQAVVLDMAQNAASANPENKRKLQAGVRKGALATGVDVDAFILTPTGFVLSGR
jgi:hypothetical protein